MRLSLIFTFVLTAGGVLAMPNPIDQLKEAPALTTIPFNSTVDLVNALDLSGEDSTADANGGIKLCGYASFLDHPGMSKPINQGGDGTCYKYDYDIRQAWIDNPTCTCTFYYGDACVGEKFMWIRAVGREGKPWPPMIVTMKYYGFQHYYCETTK